MAKLVGKLLPYVQEQVVAFQRHTPQAYSRDQGPLLLLRLSADVQQRLASMARLARERDLAFVSADLQRPDHAWVVDYLESPYSDGSARATLRVSRSHLWFDCRRQRDGYRSENEERFETRRLKLDELLSIDLLPEPSPETKPPSVVTYRRGQEVEKLLKALRRAEQALSMMSDAGPRDGPPVRSCASRWTTPGQLGAQTPQAIPELTTLQAWQDTNDAHARSRASMFEFI